jgi:ankyrin repeat protein
LFVGIHSIKEDTVTLMRTETSGALETALLAAVEANDLPTAIVLIKRGADVNKRGPLPYTPLMLAAGRGYVQMTNHLLVAGADVHALDSSLGASALHKAAQSGVIDVARLLLKHGAFINLQSATVGHTPLIDAVWAKKPAMVKFLLEQGASITLRGHHGASVWDFISKQPIWTAGFTAPENEAWGREIRELLEARQRKDEQDVSIQALMQAVQNNDLAAVKQLIAKGADVNEKSPVLGSGNDGQTPLLVACFLGHTEIVRELVQAGANPRIVDYLLKATPAHKAAYAGRPEALKLLIEQGLVELNAQGPYNGYTAIHDAVWHGHREALKVLLETDARLDLRGLDGRTALDLAIAFGYDDMAAMIKAKMQTTEAA